MKQFRVELYAEAQAHLDGIYEYIAFRLQSPIAAKRIYRRMLDDIRALNYLPERCPVIGVWKGVPLRRLLVQNYSALYVIEDDTVFITHILYSRSNIPERLGKDFSINEQEEM